MRLRISHATTYTYDPPPTGVIQVLRLTPGNHDGQYVADWHVDVSVDAKLDMQYDAFGNVTHVFSHGPLDQPHRACVGHGRDPGHRRRAEGNRRAVSADLLPAPDAS